MNPNSQNTAILAHLKRGHRITPIEALNKFECFRLGARIFDLKAEGHRIEKEMVPTSTGKRVAEYRLMAGRG